MYQDNISYLNIQNFIEQRAGVVCFSHAPDGLPLLTAVNNPPAAEVLLQQAARALGAESDHSALADTPLELMMKELDRLLKAHLIQTLRGEGDDAVEMLLLPKLVPALCGTTLLTRILKTPSANITYSTLNVGANPEARPEKTIIRSEENLPLPNVNLGQRCLGLSLEKFQPYVIKKEASRNGWPQFSLLRTFMEESIAQIPDGYYECKFYNQVSWQTEQLDPKDIAQYHFRRLQVPDAKWTWCIPRNVVVEIVIDLARCLETLHRKGEIHGDVKPENTLITAQGIVVIDSLGLAEGLKSPALTRGWAAPEQVMGFPVGYQTDQYPLGLILLALLQGVLYGEETRILIPTGGTELETHAVLKSPSVFIDPNTAPVEDESVPLWSRIIAQCLRFEPADRFPSMAELADALQSLAQEQSLTGHLSIPLSFGACVSGINETGEVKPCWLADG